MTDRVPLKVVEIGTPNFTDIPAMLRRTADDIESGRIARPRAVVMILDNEDGSIDLEGLGFPPTDVRALVGLIEMAKMRVALRDDMEGD